jgi:methionyl-tRNA formyltransferase
MKLIFAGTPQFAAIALEALLASDAEIGLVLTQPDRPAGRGLRTLPGAVKTLALERRLPLAQPVSFKEPEILARLRAVAADVMVVAAYGLILPATALAIPSRGCLNIHASLLPRWRGAAPIQRALLAGDAETGITIMQMDAGLDTGAILLQERVEIKDDDTAQSLHDRLAPLGGRCIVRALQEQPSPRVQDNARATYAGKISKAEAVIDWSRSAQEICRQIRAFNPAPGASTLLAGTLLKIWRAEPAAAPAAPAGSVISLDASGCVIAAGSGGVKITELQRAGGKRLSAGAFVSGAMLTPGARLDAPAS